jgi:hypothetical protein
MSPYVHVRCRHSREWELHFAACHHEPLNILFMVASMIDSRQWRSQRASRDVTKRASLLTGSFPSDGSCRGAITLPVVSRPLIPHDRITQTSDQLQWHGPYLRRKSLQKMLHFDLERGMSNRR